MKKTSSQTLALILVLIIFSLTVNAGCVSVVEGTTATEEPTTLPMGINYINSKEDVENLVTDNDRLVINYYDAYIWTVFFNSDNTVKSMVYIYDFKTEDEAEGMIETRKRELEKNKTMTITASYRVDSYVVMELVDTSFNGLSRDILENNFNGLIVYQ